MYLVGVYVVYKYLVGPIIDGFFGVKNLKVSLIKLLSILILLIICAVVVNNEKKEYHNEKVREPTSETSSMDKQEKKCNELVSMEQKYWYLMVEKPLGSDLNAIRQWNNAQIKARGACSVDGYLYDGIIQLNKDVMAFGKAGGFKIDY